MRGDLKLLKATNSPEMMTRERDGLVVWLRNKNDYKKLYRYGDIVYLSKDFNYVYLYLDHDKLQDTREKLQNAHFVRKIQGSNIKKLDFSIEHSQKLMATLKKEAQIFNEQNRE